MPDRRYSRTPDTYGVLAACGSAGVVVVATRTLPPSVDGLVPWWAGVVWAALLTIASIASIVGLKHRSIMQGWLYEVAGRSLLAATMGSYCVALLSVATGWGSAIPILLTGAVALSSLLRVRQVMRKLAEVRAAAQRAEGAS